MTEAINAPEEPANFCPKKTKKLKPAKADVPKNHNFKKCFSGKNARDPSFKNKMIAKITATIPYLNKVKLNGSMIFKAGPMIGNIAPHDKTAIRQSDTPKR